MKWIPKYTISNRLLSLFREIGESTGEIKSKSLAPTTIAKLELNARALSSYASTSIEGNPLPLTDVKQLLKAKKHHIRDTEREVLNYNNTLQTLYQSVRDGSFILSTKSIEQVQKKVTNGLMDNPIHCGVIRNDPVIIRNLRKVDEIIFIPPDAKDVSKLLVRLLDFINKNIGIIDPIILAGIFHREHVIIHPFMDGNGRTTRLLTTAIFGQAGLDLFEIFSFEDYYNRNITRYFKAVGLEGDYYDLQDSIDFSTWLEYFAEGILDELRRVIKLMEAKPSRQPRLEPHHRQVLEYIVQHGSITQREYGEISQRSLAARKLDFEKLVNLQLVETKGIGRGIYYMLTEED